MIRITLGIILFLALLGWVEGKSIQECIDAGKVSEAVCYASN